jgi:signal transduction histidine kinase
MDLRDALIQAGMTLSSELSLDAVLQRIIELGAEITRARYGALGVLGPDGRHLSAFHTTGISPKQRLAIGDLPVGHGLLGVLIEEAHPLRVDRIADHPDSVGFPPNHPPMTSLLGAPVVSRGTVFGDIYLTDKDGGDPFTDEDEEAILILAAQAGIAIENARLYDEVQRLVVLEDRERIAKELHDGVIQSLFAVGMGLQATAVMVGDEDLQGRIESSVGEIDMVIRDLRNYIFGLRPGVLADRQLDEAIRAIAKEFEERSGVVTAVEIDESVAAELSSSSGALIQMIREALSNVGRHAEGATCRVSLFRNGDRATLEVDDDGIGFDADTAPRGQGLANLERRAEALEGLVELRSEPGKGTTVRISVPLR